MRNIHFVFAGAIAAAGVLTAPALARNSDAPKNAEKSISPSCSAYQQAPDGTWEPLPCKESGERAQPQTQNRTSSQGADRGER
ncbi:hypothetical protein HZZ13_02660 [Bradyrhizobium sp. CNPSo 4010]|uniref:Uncharacterized protein n=1 Tax=Bradyrhizobium agreste TaxID=2751811 RepID=A0ABS0PHR5_9BRAD|nr:hypothetical protein [Bradyrhizobium agreste]MBH5396698.1 hypothetical protein [Bradyrhizobium agreste]